MAGEELYAKNMEVLIKNTGALMRRVQSLEAKLHDLQRFEQQPIVPAASYLNPIQNQSVVDIVKITTVDSGNNTWGGVRQSRTNASTNVLAASDFETNVIYGDYGVGGEPSVDDLVSVLFTGNEKISPTIYDHSIIGSGAGDHFQMIRGTCVGDVEDSDGTFMLENLIALEEDAQLPDTDPATITNQPAEEHTTGDVVYAIYNEGSDVWEALPIASGTGTPPLRMFNLVSDKTLAQTIAYGNWLDHTGDTVAGTVTLYDPDQRFSGRAVSSLYGGSPSFHGLALLRMDLDATTPGPPRYEISAMEGLSKLVSAEIYYSGGWKGKYTGVLDPDGWDWIAPADTNGDITLGTQPDPSLFEVPAETSQTKAALLYLSDPDTTPPTYTAVVDAGDKYQLIRGTCVGDVEDSDGTFMLENLIALEKDAVAPTDPTTITNQPAEAHTSGDVVYAAFNDASDVWEALPGTGSAGTPPLREFILVDDMELADTSVFAQWLDHGGVTIGTTITVHDPDARFAGRKENYISGEPAFRGLALLRADLNASTPGAPRYEIIAMEGYASWAVVQYNESPLDNWTLIDTVDNFGGDAWDHRRPVANGGALTIADPAEVKPSAPDDGDRMLVALLDPDAAPNPEYLAAAAVAKDGVRIVRGEATADVATSATTFQIDNLVALNGTAPASPLEVTMAFPVGYAENQTVMAMENINSPGQWINTPDSGRLRTSSSDMHPNFLLVKMKDQAGYVEADHELIYADQVLSDFGDGTLEGTIRLFKNRTPLLRMFELVGYKALSSNTANVKWVDSTGFTSGNTVTIYDSERRFSGRVADGLWNGSPAFRGIAQYRYDIPFTEPQYGQWEIVEMDSVYKLATAQLTYVAPPGEWRLHSFEPLNTVGWDRVNPTNALPPPNPHTVWADPVWSIISEPNEGGEHTVLVALLSPDTTPLIYHVVGADLEEHGILIEGTVTTNVQPDDAQFNIALPTIIFGDFPPPGPLLVDNHYHRDYVIGETAEVVWCVDTLNWQGVSASNKSRLLLGEVAIDAVKGQLTIFVNNLTCTNGPEPPLVAGLLWVANTGLSKHDEGDKVFVIEDRVSAPGQTIWRKVPTGPASDSVDNVFLGIVRTPAAKGSGTQGTAELVSVSTLFPLGPPDVTFYWYDLDAPCPENQYILLYLIDGEYIGTWIYPGQWFRQIENYGENKIFGTGDGPATGESGEIPFKFYDTSAKCNED